ncbi:FadR/GntR family transcriptional regulator [Propionicimonas sp.]|uniref:FadR/GntR family transcriptional regulator n=1 Tax=Propionicimonas sp. TaxID=1955623 RepID=UPI0039E4D1A1
MTPTEERDGLHAYEVVLKHIEAGILAGTHRPGDQLPPERDLAAQLGVSRSAVREAMRVLQTQGLITSSSGPGRGTRISPARGDALARIFQLHLTLSAAGTADLTETRVALERSSAALAAQRTTGRSVRKLKGLMAAMEQSDAVDEFNDLDTDFHVQIARAGQSELIADLTVAIRQAVRETIREATRLLPNWPDHRQEILNEHQEILAAIEAGDPGSAANLIERHIRRAYVTLGISGPEAG